MCFSNHAQNIIVNTPALGNVIHENLWMSFGEKIELKMEVASKTYLNKMVTKSNSNTSLILEKDM